MRRLFPLLLLCACGGGGGGDDPPDPPLPPYAETATTGLAVANSYPNATSLGTLVFAAVSEGEMGVDLNNDGDLLDSVIHRVDTAAVTAQSLGLAVVGGILVSDAHVAFLVSEVGQAGTDFNADGDFADLIWFVYDPARPLGGTNPLNTAVAAPFAGNSAGTTGGFVLLESEAAARADRNGDGDQSDIVPRVFNGATFAMSALLAPAYATATPIVARNGRVLYAASEAAQGVSLNGDADLSDFALHAIDFAPGLPTLVRIGGGVTARAVANHPFALTNNAAVYCIDEAGDGALDLNNDGDTNDAILAVFDLATGTGETLPFTPAIPSFAVPVATPVGIGVGGTRAVLAVSEAGQKRDINNDFDQIDSILAWVDTTAPATLHLHASVALATQTPAIDATRGLIAVSEGASGFQGTDLNSDGDKSDAVLHLLDTATAPGVVTNLSLATATFRVSGADALVGVDEAAQGGGDLNGNSNPTDIVRFYIDLADAVPQPRGLGIVTTSDTLFRFSAQEVRIAAVLPEGQSGTYGDLNGDGDTMDSALELITLNPSLQPPPFVSPTPFFAAECSAGIAQPLRTGPGTFVFPGSEAMANADLNGDGDLLDTVLCVTTIQ